MEGLLVRKIGAAQAILPARWGMSVGRGIAFLAVVECASVGFAQGPGSALRNLPEYYVPGTPIPVTITVVPPPGVAVVGVEDVPPTGWEVSNISQSGSFDAQSGKVKWGPFFVPSIPSEVSYGATPPGGTSGPQCFAGTASFDGANQAMGGDLCIPLAVPAIGDGGPVALSGLLAVAGAWLVHLRGKRDPVPPQRRV